MERDLRNVELVELQKVNPQAADFNKSKVQEMEGDNPQHINQSTMHHTQTNEQYFNKPIAPTPNLRYNNPKSQNNMGCKLQAEKEVLV